MPNRLPAARLNDRAKCASCKQQLLPLDRPIAVESAADFDELMRDAPGPVLVDFWATWCPPCRMVAPELEKLAAERVGQLVTAKVDTDALPEVAGRFGIRGIPTMILFRSGREAGRVSGAMPAAAIAEQLAV
jgi:thioredoxin 2